MQIYLLVMYRLKCVNLVFCSPLPHLVRIVEIQNEHCGTHMHTGSDILDIEVLFVCLLKYYFDAKKPKTLNL
jgi:hypothetical protein